MPHVLLHGLQFHCALDTLGRTTPRENIGGRVNNQPANREAMPAATSVLPYLSPLTLCPVCHAPCTMLRRPCSCQSTRDPITHLPSTLTACTDIAFVISQHHLAPTTIPPRPISQTSTGETGSKLPYPQAGQSAIRQCQQDTTKQ
ncbi:hypothetical protein N657DRAFT_377328 [Parathielavia appendiculata]|uniref:Uncharacterized protein n=1 Tax=Parathielavia appendiculata TaxID=2587402 RepID=A0AAN6U0E8_9PEZI|nr:hypothetical protein N657DRAFT_377328 [Parathielavia appendiculata]